MSEKEIELFVLAFNWYRRYKDCNPDIGMGPFIESLIDDVENMVSFKISKEDKKKITKLIYKMEI